MPCTAPPRPPTTAATAARRFVTRANYSADVGSPPQRPGTLPSFGSYCFKATVPIHEPGCPVRRLGKVTAYDTDVGVGQAAERQCRSQVNLLGSGKFACGEAEVVMLPGGASTHLQCSGEVFFELDGSTHKLV